LGRQIVYCQVCGERVVEADLVAGRAFAGAGQTYCHKCLPAGLIRHEALQEVRRSPSSTKIDRAHERPRNPSPTPATKSNAGIIAGVVVGLAIAAVLVFMMMPSGRKEPESTPAARGGAATPTPSTSPAPEIVAGDPQKAAREVYDKMREFAAANSSNHDAVIARVKQDLPKLTGTLFETDARSLLRERERSVGEAALSKSVDELSRKIVEAEKTDPLYTARPRVQGWLRDSRTACGDFTVLARRIDDLGGAYELRYQAAAVEHARVIVEKAQQLHRDGRFDEALAALDAWSHTFDDAPSVQEIRRVREEVNATKTAQERERLTGSILRDFEKATTMMNNADGSSDPGKVYKESAELYIKTLDDLNKPDMVKQQNISAGQKKVVLETSHYNIACYYARFTKDVDKAVAHLEESFKAGYKNWKHIEADTDLDLIRKMEKFKTLVGKYRK